MYGYSEKKEYDLYAAAVGQLQAIRQLADGLLLAHRAAPLLTELSALLKGMEKADAKEAGRRTKRMRTLTEALKKAIPAECAGMSAIRDGVEALLQLLPADKKTLTDADAQALTQRVAVIRGMLPADDETAPPLLEKIRSIRNTLPLDGSVWEARPYDLLTHSSGDEGGVCRESATESLAYARAHQWEQLRAFFAFEDDFLRNVRVEAARRYRSGELQAARKAKAMQAFMPKLEGEALSDCLRTPADALDKALEQLEQAPARRASYDVFDNMISYAERIARWQEDVLDDGEADGCVCIPLELKSRYDGQTSRLFELTLFCAMLYRHLRRRGVTAEQLTGHDYWRLPGGKLGFGAYQQACTAETFFSRVQKAVRELKEPPVQLLAVNGEWMANMARWLFEAFEKAGQQRAQQQPPQLVKAPVRRGGGEEAQALLAAYIRMLNGRPAVTDIEYHQDFLAVKDDGGTLAAATLRAELSRESRSGSEAAKEQDPVFLMFRDKVWRALDAEAWNECWYQMGSILLRRAKEKLTAKEGEKPPESASLSEPLKWVRVANNWVERTAALMLAYLCSMDDVVTFRIGAKAENPGESIRAVAEPLVQRDAEGKRFAEFCSSFAKTEVSARLSIRLKQEDGSFLITAKLDAECLPLNAQEQALLEDVFAYHVTPEQAEALNRLFARAWRLLGDKPPKLCGELEKLCRAGETNRQSLWSYLQTVLLWYSVRHMNKKTAAVPQNPFCAEEIPDFTRFCQHLSRHWVRWKLKKMEAAAEPGQLVSVTLEQASKGNMLDATDAEAAILTAYLDENADTPCPASDAAAHLSLLNKGFSYLIHELLYTKDRQYLYAPKTTRYVTTAANQAMYFLGVVLSKYDCMKLVSVECEWDQEKGCWLLVQKPKGKQEERKPFAFDGQDGAVTPQKLYEYYREKFDTHRKNRYTLICTKATDSGFHLKVELSSGKKDGK